MLVKKLIELIKLKIVLLMFEFIVYFGEDVYEFERVLVRRKRGRGE